MQGLTRKEQVAGDVERGAVSLMAAVVPNLPLEVINHACLVQSGCLDPALSSFAPRPLELQQFHRWVCHRRICPLKKNKNAGSLLYLVRIVPKSSRSPFFSPKFSWRGFLLSNIVKSSPLGCFHFAFHIYLSDSSLTSVSDSSRSRMEEIFAPSLGLCPSFISCVFLDKPISNNLTRYFFLKKSMQFCILLSQNLLSVVLFKGHKVSY